MSFGIKDLREKMKLKTLDNPLWEDVIKDKVFTVSVIVKDNHERMVCQVEETTSFFFEWDINWLETAKINGIYLERKELEQFHEDTKPSIKEVNEGMERVFAQVENSEKQYNPKYDQGKLDWTLLPINEIEEVVKVLDYGKNKYSENAWQGVENAEKRYLSATYRHLVEYQKGNKVDEESGLSHLSHLATNVLFLMWLENNKGE